MEEASIVGNPILIFNEDNVWYPLMGRDDTNEDTMLKDLVNTYATDTQTPVLTLFEESLIEDLRIVTQLPDENQYVLAVVIIDHDRERCFFWMVGGYPSRGGYWLHGFKFLSDVKCVERDYQSKNGAVVVLMAKTL